MAIFGGVARFGSNLIGVTVRHQNAPYQENFKGLPLESNLIGRDVVVSSSLCMTPAGYSLAEVQMGNRNNSPTKPDFSRPLISRGI